MNGILNGGQYIPPLTLKKLDPSAVPQGHRVVSGATSRTMLDLMRLNVTEPEGSGKKADVPGYAVGGKTGSAEKAIGGRIDRKRLVSSFAAVFPTDGPMNADRYFVLIMLDEPQPTKQTYGFATGGWTAAPAAGRVIERITPYPRRQARARSTVASQTTGAATAAPMELQEGALRAPSASPRWWHADPRRRPLDRGRSTADSRQVGPSASCSVRPCRERAG